MYVVVASSRMFSLIHETSGLRIPIFSLRLTNVYLKDKRQVAHVNEKK